MKRKYLYFLIVIFIILAGFIERPVEGKTEAEEKKERMLRDTFSFFRGDIESFYRYGLSHKPSLKEDLTIIQLHGDTHIENFGLWRTDGGINFGLIDFEETARGPFYLDLERFAIGLVLVSHERNINEDRKIIRTLLKSYISQLEKIKDGQGEGAKVLKIKENYSLVKKVWESGEKVTRLEFLNGYGGTSLNEKGERVFKASYDFIPLDTGTMETTLNIYLESLPTQYRKGKDFYKIKDAVQVKRCGLGSLGNLKYRILIEGPSKAQDDDYILELREATSPAITFVTSEYSAPCESQANRICQAQKMIQKATSAFLGYTKFDGKDFLVDEVYPCYSTVRTDGLKTLKDFLDLAEISGCILADAHSRTIQVSNILAEIEGNKDRFFEEMENIILDYSYISGLKTLSTRLQDARVRWINSLEDKYNEKALEEAYKNMQAYCRNFLKKNGSFKIEEMAKMAEEVRYPYEVYYNDLYIEANKLKEQLFNITTPGTIANSYFERPTEENFANLKTLFDRIYKYYIGKSYSWNRYLNKYLFQKSRLEHYHKEWVYWDGEFRLSGSPFNREMAKFCYERLKKEIETNNLPLAGEVNAFYLSKDFDDYYKELLYQKKLERIRQEKGYEKEVVVLIHGLGEDRFSWKLLPSLLAHEDTVTPDLKKYFKVYLFRFDTIEDSKSVVNFTREFSGFIREVERREDVEKVNIIAHSLGGVITLKYLTKNTDPDFDLRPSGDEMRVLLSSQKVLEGFLADNYCNNIKRFIGLAPSFSGSKVANAAVEIFKKPEAWFEDNVKAIYKGDVPTKGDIQVEENQIGSGVNLDSFMRLDLERPLDPVNLSTIPGVNRKLSALQKNKLQEKEVKVLTIIGNPPRTISRSEDYRGKKEFGTSEDDGLVRVYSANLNHNYFIDNEAGENIGYQKGEVRYLPLGHFELIEFTSRNHPAYKYIVSFLNDNLIPQDNEKDSAIKTFGIVLRVTPKETVNEYPDIFFSNTTKDYYLKERLLTLPPLEIELAKDAPGFSKELVMQERGWNSKTGSSFEQGSFTTDGMKKSHVVYRLKAEGYKTRLISIPVTAGELSYASHLTLEKE